MADFGGWLMPIEYPGAGVLAEADSEGAGDEACSSLTPVVEHAESKRPEINSAAMAA